MNNIHIINREMTPAEFSRMNAGFDEHTLDNNVDIQQSERFGFVGLHGDSFIGCSSGLAYKNGKTYSGWFFLTDLFVEKDYRSQGIGSKLLISLEDQIAAIGVSHIYLWTSHDGAINFYRRHGYGTFAQMENWYSDGKGRIGMRKDL